MIASSLARVALLQNGVDVDDGVNVDDGVDVEVARTRSAGARSARS